MYMVATGILVVGFSYAAVPLYRMFCATTGFGGSTKRDEDGEKVGLSLSAAVHRCAPAPHCREPRTRAHTRSDWAGASHTNCVTMAPMC